MTRLGGQVRGMGVLDLNDFMNLNDLNDVKDLKVGVIGAGERVWVFDPEELKDSQDLTKK